MTLRTAFALVPLAVALAACSSSSTPASTSTPQGTGTTTGAGGATGAGGGATGSGGATTGAGGGATGSGGATTGAGGAGGATTGTGGSGGAPAPIGACSEIGATDCFSSYDCADAERCENRGSELVPVPCCVPGERGTGKLGDPCTKESDCESALCIDGAICTETCQSDGDCPPSLPTCIPIAFSGSSDKFCTP